jgi:hypothetical protein
MNRCIKVLACGFTALIFASTVQANESQADNSINCVESKIEKLSQSDEGQKKLESINALDLGEECGKEHGWTKRKATASSFFAVSKTMLQKTKESWAATGFASDLPDRIKVRMTIAQLNDMVLRNKYTDFRKILAQELAVTGSKLNPDDSIDKLSLLESSTLGQKLGQRLMSLFLVEEFQQFYDDPSHSSPELIALFSAIEPRSTEILARLN